MNNIPKSLALHNLPATITTSLANVCGIHISIVSGNIQKLTFSLDDDLDDGDTKID